MGNEQRRGLFADDPRSLMSRVSDSKGVHGVAFSLDGRILATGDDNGNVYLWNVATQGLMATLTGPKGGTVQSIAFSPRAGILAATSDNDHGHKYATCVWTISGRLLGTFHNPGSMGLTRLAFSPDGNILAVGDENANTYIWDVKRLGS
jgi:WD40 repeat protein